MEDFIAREIIYIAHRSPHRGWIESLGRNLEQLGYRPAINGGPPGPQHIEPGDLHKLILIADSLAVETGWVREQLTEFQKRSLSDSEFRFVPIIFGDTEPPIEEGVCIDFRQASPETYHRNFLQLLIALGQSNARRSLQAVDLEMPPPHPSSAESSAEVASETSNFVDQIFDELGRGSILMLLAQADCDLRTTLGRIKKRGGERFGENNVFHISPYFSRRADVDRSFVHFARQCGFTAEVTCSEEWEECLGEHLQQHRNSFLIVTRFENGSEELREELSGILRGLVELHPGLRVLLSGGERLADMKYGQGELSLLNIAKVVFWPELTVQDLLEIHKSEFPNLDLETETAQLYLDLSGRHPSLARAMLEYEARTARPWERDSDPAQLGVWHWFTPYRTQAETRERLCRLLEQDTLGPFEPWPEDPLLRSLFWKNLLVPRDERFSWRCGALQSVGRKALGCA